MGSFDPTEVSIGLCVQKVLLEHIVNLPSYSHIHVTTVDVVTLVFSA